MSSKEWGREREWMRLAPGMRRQEPARLCSVSIRAALEGMGVPIGRTAVRLAPSSYVAEPTKPRILLKRRISFSNLL